MQSRPIKFIFSAPGLVTVSTANGIVIFVQCPRGSRRGSFPPNLNLPSTGATKTAMEDDDSAAPPPLSAEEARRLLEERGSREQELRDRLLATWQRRQQEVGDQATVGQQAVGSGDAVGRARCPR